NTFLSSCDLIAGSIVVDKMFMDSAVKPSASPRGEPQNDEFKAFRNSLSLLKRGILRSEPCTI
ncbi:MAG: hypothetical protein ABIH18_03035, partial [Candidatus Omnitrophota bacterium]